MTILTIGTISSRESLYRDSGSTTIESLLF
nr:MAG TPA: hypothetical protein [Caudoviricetes sp.]